MMRVVQLWGGLGNQLFQVAHAYKLVSEPGGGPVALDLSWFDKQSAESHKRDVGVDTANLDFETVRLSRFLWSERLNLAVTDAGEAWKSKVTKWIANRQLHRGYWQSWQDVQTQKKPMTRLLARGRRHLTEIDYVRAPYLAVHVRLGDYLMVPSIREFHGATDFVHQIAIAREVASHMGVSEIRVFTDSFQVVYDAISPSEDVVISDANDPWTVLNEMASGQGIVMSNSSLSWWSAVWASWLYDGSFTVLMPHPWFRAPSSLDEHLRVPGWNSYDRRLGD